MNFTRIQNKNKFEVAGEKRGKEESKERMKNIKIKIQELLVLKKKQRKEKRTFLIKKSLSKSNNKQKKIIEKRKINSDRTIFEEEETVYLPIEQKEEKNYVPLLENYLEIFDFNFNFE